MSLSLVAGERAGPHALGLLVPPGARTVLILRPRSLSCDLLLLQGVSGTAFREMNRLEAEGAAQAVYAALVAWNAGGPGIVHPVTTAAGFQVWVDLGDFCLLSCERRPGQSYQPVLLATEAEARQMAASIASVLHPGDTTEQEVYFNTRHFSR